MADPGSGCIGCEQAFARGLVIRKQAKQETVVAVVSIFNATNLGAPNFGNALANATSTSLQTGAAVTINGRSYTNVFEIDFTIGGQKYQDLLAGTGLAINSGNALTAGTISGLIENIWDGLKWTPTWLIQDISLPATTVFQAYQTSGNADDLSVIATALKTDDVISGSSNAPDTILAGDGNDLIFVGGTGGNTIDGGNGSDTAVFAGLLVERSVTKNANGSLTITSPSSSSPDNISNVEQVAFSDYTLVLDLSSSQDALVYRLYQAAFARTPDNAGFRFWAAQADRTQMSAVALAD